MVYHSVRIRTPGNPLILWIGGFFRTFEHFHVADLFPALDVVVDHDLVVVQIHRVDEHIEDALLEFRIAWIPIAELAQEVENLLLGVADAGGDAEPRQRHLQVFALRVQQVGLLFYPLAKDFGICGAEIVRALFDVALQLGQLLLHLGDLGRAEFVVIGRDDSLGDILHARGLEDVFDGLLDHIPFQEALLFVHLFAGVRFFPGGAGVVIIHRAAFSAPALADQRRATLAAVNLTAEVVGFDGLLRRRRAPVVPDHGLDAFEGFDVE